MPGRRFDVMEGEEDEDWEGLTPLTPVCENGGGGRFIFGVWEAAGLETAVAILPMPAARHRTSQQSTGAP